MSPRATRPARLFPNNAWYALGRSDEVGRSPVGRRVLGRGVALYRDRSGTPIALADRCVHRPYPLSMGEVVGDNIVSGYSGFVYGPDGVVVSVPTQENTPVGAAVRSFPVVDHGGLVWVWLGTPDRAHRRPLLDLPWLDGPGWSTFGDSWHTQASGLLLQDNFSDITHVAIVDPLLSPPALQRRPPRLNVEVSEQQVRFWRDFPASPLQTWQCEALGIAAGAEFEQREEGLFASPGLWVDRWDVRTGQDGEDASTMYFTHAITPVDERTTLHHWRVSRNFAHSAQATGTLQPLLTRYYRRVQDALETMQQVIDLDGSGREVNVMADSAMLQVRKVMRRLLAEDGASYD